jgi:iron complex transport system substrate-binding protein
MPGAVAAGVIDSCTLMDLMRIVSLVPAATEIAAALGLIDQVVGVSHECDFPDEASQRPRITRCSVHNAGLTSREVDQWVPADVA